MAQQTSKNHRTTSRIALLIGASALVGTRAPASTPFYPAAIRDCLQGSAQKLLGGDRFIAVP
jgi:hypothetical protein